MTTVYLMRTGRTTWDEQNRMDSATGSPLSPAGAEQVAAAGKELASHHIQAIYASTNEADRQTAALLAEALGVKVRTRKDLREIDYGLWQGLTTEEIRRRQPKVYKQWREAPSGVRPPEGESPAEAQQRLRGVLKEVVRKHKGEAVLLVLRPVAMALLRCLLQQQSVDVLWQTVADPFVYDSFEMDARPL